MIHRMNLHNEPFEAIKNKTKTIELRLFDEKRQIIKKADTIIFTNILTEKSIECLVSNIYKYTSFEELYKHHDKISMGYKEDENSDPNDMLKYYSIENIKKYGVMGIEIKVMKWFS